MLRFKQALVIVSLFIVPLLSLMLECDFVFNDWEYSGNRYSCSAKNLEVLEQNMRFLSMDGTHLYNKSNSDVLGILFDRQFMTFLVQGSAAFFSKLEDFSVTFSGLTYIQRNDFRHTKNLKTIFLCNNLIQRIPQDTFVDLTKLEYLSLSSNEIKSLPSFIFRPLISLRGLYLNSNKLEEISHLLLKHSEKLEEVWLQENNLKVISSNISEPLHGLKHLLLRDNICISKDYTDNDDLERFKHDITANCSSECEQKMNEVSECNEKFFELEKENENLRKEVLKLRNYMRSFLIV